MSRKKTERFVKEYFAEAGGKKRQKISRAVAKKPVAPSHNRNISGASDHDFSRNASRNSNSAIDEVVREATAGGVIYRLREGRLEILLVADHFGRWTIPKGHIEPGETAQQAAIRESGEEAGMHELEPTCWLGKIHFRYCRENILVLMSTQIYLFRALGNTDDIAKEDWMKGIKWFDFEAALRVIAYDDIAKLMLMARSRLRDRGEI